MDDKRSRVPVLWDDDRGVVAKTFDVCILSNMYNLDVYQFRLGGLPVLEDVLSEDDHRFFPERVLLTACPTHAQRRVGPSEHEFFVMIGGSSL